MPVAIEAVQTGKAATAKAKDEPSGASEMRSETVTLSVPPSATQDEAAAIATAVGTHLTDCAAARNAAEASQRCPRWKLSGRLGTRSIPLEAVHGDEWKAAARSRY